MSTRNFINSIPPVTRHLLIINIVVWLVTSAMYHLQGFDVTRWLGLHYVEAPAFNPVQLVTYMFLHDTNSFAHIFFNMFSLYIFGKILEQVMGSKRFLTYYMVCGVGAALIQEAAMAYSLHPIVANYEGVDLGHGMPQGRFSEYCSRSVCFSPMLRSTCSSFLCLLKANIWLSATV